MTKIKLYFTGIKVHVVGGRVFYKKRPVTYNDRLLNRHVDSLYNKAKEIIKRLQSVGQSVHDFYLYQVTERQFVFTTTDDITRLPIDTFPFDVFVDECVSTESTKTLIDDLKRMLPDDVFQHTYKIDVLDDSLNKTETVELLEKEDRNKAVVNDLYRLVYTQLIRRAYQILHDEYSALYFRYKRLDQRTIHYVRFLTEKCGTNINFTEERLWECLEPFRDTINTELLKRHTDRPLLFAFLLSIIKRQKVIDGLPTMQKETEAWHAYIRYRLMNFYTPSAI